MIETIKHNDMLTMVYVTNEPLDKVEKLYLKLCNKYDSVQNYVDISWLDGNTCNGFFSVD